MLNKLTSYGLIVVIGVLWSGCTTTATETIKPTVSEIRTTKEVLIPHNDNVKNAVAILISKVNVLEGKEPSKVLYTNVELIESRCGIRDKEIKNHSKRLNQLEKIISRKQSENKLKSTSQKPIANSQVRVDKVKEIESTNHDEIIREFLERDELK